MFDLIVNVWWLFQGLTLWCAIPDYLDVQEECVRERESFWVGRDSKTKFYQHRISVRIILYHIDIVMFGWNGRRFNFYRIELFPSHKLTMKWKWIEMIVYTQCRVENLKDLIVKTICLHLFNAWYRMSLEKRYRSQELLLPFNRNAAWYKQSSAIAYTCVFASWSITIFGIQAHETVSNFNFKYDIVSCLQHSMEQLRKTSKQK